MNLPEGPKPHVEVRRSARRKRTVTAYRERDTIVVLVPQRMTRADEAGMVDSMVARLLAREARASVPRGDQALLGRALSLADTCLAPRIGSLTPPESVSWVSNQQQRWGSCTPANRTIRLSHRLQPFPDWVVDYVLVHELVHLIEPTHSARFWDLVATYPAAERAKGFLEGYVAGQSQPTGSGALRTTKADAGADEPHCA